MKNKGKRKKNQEREDKGEKKRKPKKVLIINHVHKAPVKSFEIPLGFKGKSYSLKG